MKSIVRRRLLSLCVFALLSSVVSPFLAESASAAETRKGYVTLESDEKIYVEFTEGQEGAPTFVLLNGLIHDIRRWDKLTAQLIQSGATVVNYSYSGQPENLRRLEKGEEPSFFAKGLEAKDLAIELKRVLKTLKIDRPIQLVGLSYGAAVAAEYARLAPKTIQNTILMSPLVVPLDTYSADSVAFRNWLLGVRFSENYYCEQFGTWNPMLCLYRDFWYDQFYNYYYETYLQERVQRIPAGVDEGIYKKSVFHLVRAMRDFDLKDYVRLMPNVHMMLAGADDVPLRQDQLRVWATLPESSRKSLVTFEGAAHALPDVTPLAAAEWLLDIAAARPELQRGQEYVVTENGAVSGQTVPGTTQPQVETDVEVETEVEVVTELEADR